MKHQNRSKFRYQNSLSRREMFNFDVIFRSTKENAYARVHANQSLRRASLLHINSPVLSFSLSLSLRSPARSAQILYNKYAFIASAYYFNTLSRPASAMGTQTRSRSPVVISFCWSLLRARARERKECTGDSTVPFAQASERQRGRRELCKDYVY